MPARTKPRTETKYQIAQNPAARAAIMSAWASCNGRPDDVASALDLSRSTLYREIGRLWSGRSPEQIAADLPGYRATVA